MFPLLNANKHIVITHYQIKQCVKRSNYDFIISAMGNIGFYRCTPSRNQQFLMLRKVCCSNPPRGAAHACHRRQ